MKALLRPLSRWSLTGAMTLPAPQFVPIIRRFPSPLQALNKAPFPLGNRSLHSSAIAQKAFEYTLSSENILPDDHKKLHRVVSSDEDDGKGTWILKSPRLYGGIPESGMQDNRLIEMFAQNLALQIFKKSPRTMLAKDKGMILSEVLSPGDSTDLFAYLFEHLPASNKKIAPNLQIEIMRIALFKLLMGDRDIKTDNIIIVNYDSYGSYAYPIDGEFSLRVNKAGTLNNNTKDINDIFKKAITADGLAEILADTRNIYNTQTDYSRDVGDDQIEIMKKLRGRLFYGIKDDVVAAQMEEMISLLSRDDFQHNAMEVTKKHIAESTQYSDEQRKAMTESVDGFHGDMVKHIKLFSGMMAKHKEESKITPERLMDEVKASSVDKGRGI